jgi:hypothetical protein
MPRPGTRCVALLIAAAAPAIVGCGADFKAVKAAGVAGQRIDGTVAFASAAEVCYELRALGAKPADDCAVLQTQGASWDKIASAMAAYAAKLGALAGQDDPSVTDQVNAALGAASKAKWTSLTTDQNKAIADFANAVVALLSTEYRAGVLDDVIRNTDKHVHDVSVMLETEIDKRTADIDSLTTLATQVGSFEQTTPRPVAFAPPPSPPPAPTPPPVPTSGQKLGSKVAPKAATAPVAPPGEHGEAFEAWTKDSMKKVEGWTGDEAAFDKLAGQASGASLAMMVQDLAAKKHAYVQLKASIEGFRAAHETLAKNVGHLDNAGQVLPQVVQVIQSAVAAVLAMETPAGKTSPSGGASSTTTH